MKVCSTPLAYPNEIPTKKYTSIEGFTRRNTLISHHFLDSKIPQIWRNLKIILKSIQIAMESYHKMACCYHKDMQDMIYFNVLYVVLAGQVTGFAIWSYHIYGVTTGIALAYAMSQLFVAGAIMLFFYCVIQYVYVLFGLYY